MSQHDTPHPSKLKIILAAEAHFARDGVEGASLRDISMAAGHKNKFAAQYHFKDRDGLILAIMRYRRPRADQLRARFLGDLGLTIEESSDELLIKCILQSLVQLGADEERQSYGRFLYALLHYGKGQVLWTASGEAAPFTHRLYAELRRRLSDLSDDAWQVRIRMFGRLCIDIAANHREIAPARMTVDDAFIDELCLLLGAMLHAPVRGEGGLPLRRDQSSVQV